MKSTRRHELKENVLAKELSWLGSFVRTHSRWLMTGALVLVVVILAIVVIVSRSRSARQHELQSYFTLTGGPSEDAGKTRKQLLSLAEDADEDLAAWARLRAGVDAAEELAIKYTGLDDEKRKALAAEATSALTLVVTKHAENPRAVAVAQFWLGQLAEEHGKTAEAEDHYAKARAAGRGDETVIGALAGLRTNELKSARPVMSVFPHSPPVDLTPTGGAGDQPPTSGPATTAPAPPMPPASAPVG